MKAHTLRIWEKRYQLLAPDRTDTNIRYYDIKNLQKLLNVKYLYDNQFKISKIAQLGSEKLSIKVRELITEKGFEGQSSNALKLAMLNFDHSLFENTYNQLLAEKTFRGVFQEVFIPFLDQIGYLWQSETITPAHEHFISNLIKQKLHSNIERVQLRQAENDDKVFALYLPMHEIHELGLLYIHYELTLRGYQSIYLGQSVPLENLNEVQSLYQNVVFISYFTVYPETDGLSTYLNELEELLENGNNKAYVLGKKVSEIESFSSKSIKMFKNISEIFNKI